MVWCASSVKLLCVGSLSSFVNIRGVFLSARSLIRQASPGHYLTTSLTTFTPILRYRGQCLCAAAKACTCCTSFQARCWAIDHPHDESCPQLTVLEALGFNRFESDETNVSIAQIVAGIAECSATALAAPIPSPVSHLR